VDWVIKASKLCNLRCRYCYEWNELGDPTRMSLATWRHVLTAVRDYADQLRRRVGGRIRSRLIWHGGEPLLLPNAYIEQVMELQEEVFGADALAGCAFQNTVQSNLYALPSSKLELLLAKRFAIGVSMDFVGGVRLDRHGRETEERVVANMDRLARAGVPFGVILVLAAHTRPHLCRAHDFFADIGIPFRVLPLHCSPLGSPDAPFALSNKDIVAGLCELFVHWLDQGCRVGVQPLNEYLQATLMHMNGLQRSPFDRRRHGDTVLIVNTDGWLFTYDGFYGYEREYALGDLTRHSVAEISRSARLERSLGASEARERQRCTSCRYRAACGSYPLYQMFDRDPPGERCGIAYETYRFIESHLRASGCDDAFFAELLDEVFESESVTAL